MKRLNAERLLHGTLEAETAGEKNSSGELSMGLMPVCNPSYSKSVFYNSSNASEQLD